MYGGTGMSVGILLVVVEEDEEMCGVGWYTHKMGVVSGQAQE